MERLTMHQELNTKIARILVAAILGCLLWAAESIGQTVPAESQHRFEASEVIMGSPVAIVLYAPDQARADVGFAAAFAAVRSIDASMSNYRSDSEVMLLSKSAPHANPVRISEDLMAVLVLSDSLSRKTEGAFDITVGPATKLWRRARRQRQLPNSELLQSTLDAIGYRHIELHEADSQVRLLKANMLIDLGGIAKGYAADRAIDALRKQGISSALVNAGGDIALSNAPPGHDGWQVQVASGIRSEAATQTNDPSAPDSQTRLVLANQAVATSGDAYQFVEIDGVRYSHIIDPRTGVGVTTRKAATVIAPTCAEADGWASALCVMDVEKGLNLFNCSRTIQAQVVYATGDTIQIARTKTFPVPK